MMMNWRERITIDPEVLAGKPGVKGTRLSVELVVGLLAEGWTDQQLLANYPSLGADDVRAGRAGARINQRAERLVATSQVGQSA